MLCTYGWNDHERRSSMLCCSHEQRVAPPRAGTTSDVGGGSTVVGVLSRCSGAGSDDRAAAGGVLCCWMKVGPFFFFLPFWPRTLHIASNGGLTSASHRLPPRQPRLACPNRARPRLQQHVLPSAALVPTYLSFFPVLFGTSRRQPPLPFPNMSRPSTTEERTTGECPPSRSVLRRTTTAGSAVMS